MASRLTAKEKQEIYQMYLSGKYYIREIADWLGVSYSTIQKYIQQREEKVMIMTEKPYGALNDKSIQYRFEEDGNYYVVDVAYNKYLVSEKDYKKLTCPIKKFRRKARY